MKTARIQFISAMIIVGSISLFVRSIPLPSQHIALVRGSLGFVFIIAFGLLSGQKFRLQNIRANRWVLLFSGIALGVNWILLFQAYKYTTVSNATICYYFAPVLVMILSPLILKEALDARKVLCILAALAGLSCIAGVSNGAGANHFLGITYGLLAAVFYTSVIFLNKRLKDIAGIESSLVQLGISAVALLPYVLLTGGIVPGRMAPVSIVLLLIVGLVHTGVVYLLYFTSLRQLSGQSAAALSYIDPVVALLLAAVFLQERMTWLQLAGAILILGATFVNEAGVLKKK